MTGRFRQDARSSPAHRPASARRSPNCWPQKGYAVVLTARRGRSARGAGGGAASRSTASPRTRSSPISRSRTHRSRSRRSWRRGSSAIDLLVNNAGYGVPGSYVNVPWIEHERFMQVMVIAVCDLTYRLLPGMIDRGWGRIINIASVAGLVPAPAGHTLVRRVEGVRDPLLGSAVRRERAEGRATARRCARASR